MNTIKYKDIDEYIKMQPEQVQQQLVQLRQCIKKAAPESEELISYQMPAFKLQGVLVYFAAFTKHYSLFVKPKVLDVFKERLTEYKLSKSAIRFPTNTSFPEALVTEIITYTATQNLEKRLNKYARKTKKAK
ncbi:MAG: iron chaperone [Bacteroidales bacterium]